MSCFEHPVTRVDLSYQGFRILRQKPDSEQPRVQQSSNAVGKRAAARLSKYTSSQTYAFSLFVPLPVSCTYCTLQCCGYFENLIYFNITVSSNGSIRTAVYQVDDLAWYQNTQIYYPEGKEEKKRKKSKYQIYVELTKSCANHTGITMTGR